MQEMQTPFNVHYFLIEILLLKLAPQRQYTYSPGREQNTNKIFVVLGMPSKTRPKGLLDPKLDCNLSVSEFLRKVLTT